MPVSKRKGKRRKVIQARKKEHRREMEGQKTAKGRKSFIRKHAKDFRKFYQEHMDKIVAPQDIGMPEVMTAEQYEEWRSNQLLNEEE